MLRTTMFLQDNTLMKAFKFFDKENSGFISKNDLKCVFSTHSDLFNIFDESDYDVVIDEADINKDGRISYEEFVRFMTQEMSEINF